MCNSDSRFLSNDDQNNQKIQIQNTCQKYVVGAIGALVASDVGSEVAKLTFRPNTWTEFLLVATVAMFAERMVPFSIRNGMPAMMSRRMQNWEEAGLAGWLLLGKI